jgi:Flp pilus assembly pilin Flp
MQSPAAVSTFRQLADVRSRRSKDDGQDLLEYGLLAALVAMIALGAVTALGNTISTVFWNAIAAASL